MFHLFNNYRFSTLFLLLAYAIALSFAIWGQNQALLSAKPDAAGPLFFWPQAAWQGQMIWLSMWSLIIFSFNALVNRFRLSRRPGYLLGLGMMLMMLLFPHVLNPGSALSASPLLAWALWQLFSGSEKKNMATQDIYTAGFAAGLSVLLHLPNIWLWPAFILGLWLLRGWSLREQIVLILGLINPHFLGLSYAYVFQPDAMPAFFPSFGIPDFSALSWTPWQVLALLFWALLGIWSLMNYNSVVYKIGLKDQKNIQIFYLILFFSICSLFSCPQPVWADFLPLGLSVGLFMGLNFYLIKESSSAELLHGLLLAYVVLVQYVF